MTRSLIASAFVAVALLFNATAALAGSGNKGTFTGASDHITTGTVEIVQEGGSYVVKLGSDFSLDGAPDPKVGFGKDGQYVDGTLIGILKSLTGEQDYVVPASLDISDFNEVYIWCEQFSVPLGVASLK